jgi:3-oxoacyl-[acyl-carrier protein] reductase
VHPSQWLGGVISDLTSENVIDSIWEILEKRSGQLKAVFINTPSPAMALPEEVTATQWSYAFQSLVRFPDEMLRRACQTMSLTGGGVVVVNSSCSARIPIDEEFYLSNTLRMVSVAQARAFARRYVNKGVRINVLLTGFTDTALTRSLAGTLSEQTGQNMKDIWSFWESAIPSRRLARPEEIAQVAAFLFSEHSSYINGAAIEVDGGLSMLNSNI